MPYVQQMFFLWFDITLFVITYWPGLTTWLPTLILGAE